jgi:hypothetical protein
VLPEPLSVTLKVTTVLDRLGIPYFLGGSLASSVFGVIRATLDADLVAGLRVEHIPGLVETLKSEFYIDEEMILDAILHAGSFNLIHLESMFKVDVFILKPQPFDLNQMNRRVLLTIGDEGTDRMYFSTAEDLILAKLAWFRAGGEVSERQWGDVLGMLSLQSGRLDHAYLRTWAKTLGLADLLQKAIQTGTD